MSRMTVKHDGKTLTLTQEPYIDTVLNMRIGDTVEVIDGDVYRASAVDADGGEYGVYWTRLTKDGEVADWDQYTVIER